MVKTNVKTPWPKLVRMGNGKTNNCDEMGNWQEIKGDRQGSSCHSCPFCDSTGYTILPILPPFTDFTAISHLWGMPFYHSYDSSPSPTETRIRGRITPTCFLREEANPVKRYNLQGRSLGSLFILARLGCNCNRGTSQTSLYSQSAYSVQ